MIREKIAIIYQGKFMEEHLAIYNRHQLTESYVIALRLTTQDQLRFFYMSPGTKSQYAFNKLENTVTKFLSDFHNMFDSVVTNINEIKERSYDVDVTSGPPKDAKSVSKQCLALLTNTFKSNHYDDLYFDLVYITDELVFYGLKGYVGHFVFQLANLFYSVVLNHAIMNELLSFGAVDILQRIWKQWVGQLTHFLSHFPKGYKGTSVLKRLLQEVKQKIRFATKR